MNKLLLLLPISLLCSCGPSGGKRLATEQVLHSLEELQKEPDADFYLSQAQRQINDAKAAGDPSRKADVQVSLDLDFCSKTALAMYSSYEERRVWGEAARRLGTKAPSLDERKSQAQEAINNCVSSLRRDLGQ